MSDGFVRKPPKLKQGEVLHASGLGRCYCEACKLYGECPASGRDIYVQGGYPWDCIFCEKCCHWPDTFQECPYRSSERLDGVAHKGCVKLNEDGTGTFCNIAVRKIHIRGDHGLIPACAKYEFDVFAASKTCIQYETYWYGMKHKCVREAVNEMQWLTLADMLQHVTLSMLEKFAKKRCYAVRAWESLEEVADVFGFDSLGNCFSSRTVGTQMLRVSRTVAMNQYKKLRFEHSAREERRNKRKEGAKA